jgi:hypothetical protein
LAVEFVFGALHLIPQERNLAITEEAVSWNYTTWLNIAFLLISSLLVWRFIRTGGPEMLRMMSRPIGGAGGAPTIITGL